MVAGAPPRKLQVLRTIHVRGGSGNDVITAGSGREIVYGGSGNDTIIGGTGYDDLTGGSGTDTIYGHGVHDVLNSGGGNATIISADQAAYDATTPPATFSLPSQLSGGPLSPDDSSSFTATQLSTHDVLDFHGPYNTLINTTYVMGPYGDGDAVEDDYGAAITPGLAWAPSFLITSGNRLASGSATEVAVYVDWDPEALYPIGTNWTKDAYYVLYDGATQIGEERIDQTQPCNDNSPDPGETPWHQLMINGNGVFPITSGYLTVGFCLGDPNNNYAVTSANPMYIDAVMVEPFWPGVGILPDVNGGRANHPPRPGGQAVGTLDADAGGDDAKPGQPVDLDPKHLRRQRQLAGGTPRPAGIELDPGIYHGDRRQSPHGCSRRVRHKLADDREPDERHGVGPGGIRHGHGPRHDRA